MALIALARATELVPNFPSSDNGVLQDCIDAASDVIERWCNRTFAVTTYDELYDGTGSMNLLLNNYPITQVLRVSFDPINVLQIHMTDITSSRASWRLDGDTNTPPNPNNLYLVSLKNGIETDITIGPLTSTTPTITINGTPTTISQMLTYNDLANVINTYGGTYGWSAQALGIYTTWPVAELRPPQGAFESKWFGVSYAKLHSWNLMDFEQNPDIGEIVSPMGFAFGYRNYRIVYQAGYATIPNPVQQACAALAVSVYNSRAVNANLANENLGGYSYSNIAEKNFHSLDIVSRFSLPLYKNHRIAKFKITM
jgi:hypothetical protein